MAENHGAAHAVGGCAIYVSDKPGQYEFNLPKKLVLPDGSISRAKLSGRRTRDCLFSDPCRDGKSLLKIWKPNDFSGVMGVFNCQGASWVGKTNLMHDQKPGMISGSVRAKDVDYLPRIASDGWTGDSVFYSHVAGEVFCISKDATMLLWGFAPIGLTKMFDCNQEGAI